MGDTSMIHTEYALVKIIEDHDSVRLKICPRREPEHLSKANHVSGDRRGIETMQEFVDRQNEPPVEGLIEGLPLTRSEVKSVVAEYVEVQETEDGPAPLETEMSWHECNLMIQALRRHRDRVFGTPA